MIVIIIEKRMRLKHLLWKLAFFEAAKLLPANSVDAVDLNCGCPQGIARKGHYGAYLLSEPDVPLGPL